MADPAPLCKIARETGGPIPLACLFECPHRCGEPEPVPGGLVTIIAGSREGVTLDDVTQAVQAAPWRPSVVVSGMAPGADRLGLRWASLNRVATVEKPAKWQRADGSTDRGAGHKRNTEMAAMAEALIAIWDGKSPGTNHMIQTALARGLRVYVWKPRSAR